MRGRNWTLIVSAKDLGMLILLSAGCYRLMSGRISIGEFWIFMSYLGLLFWPMVAGGVALMICGQIWIYKLVNFKV